MIRQNKSITDIRIGLLGGGQLGRMLLQKAADYDLDFKVLDPDPDAPCRYLVKDFTCGSFNDFHEVYEFGKTCDVVTVEIEHVNVEALEKLASEGIQIYPQPHILKMVKDKGDQKVFYSNHNIPTASFELIEKKSQITRAFPFIMKTRTGGYDGKGVMKINDAAELESKGFTTPSVIEEVIPFAKELAVIVARKKNGDIRLFPVVEMEFNQEANLVEFLFSPASVSESVSQEAKDIARKIAEKLELTGILAVELFLTADEKLYVNEIAPRPHNSGHHTIEGNYTSQYEQHLRAILDLPLGETETLLPAVMINLLGEKGFSGTVKYENLEEAQKEGNIHIHLYGKKQTRPFRKMGHVTVTAKNLEEAKTIARKVQSIIRVIAHDEKK
jgi:5-(carboxyamino)imidazole ribonucleotide synthase